MAKFWSKIRNVIHNIPIFGGMSVNDAKAAVDVIKNDPGGQVVYTPPAPAPIGVTAPGQVSEHVSVGGGVNIFFWGAVIIAIYYFWGK